MHEVAVIRDTEQAAAVLQAGRLALLAERRAPDSAAGLARRLRMPRQRVNYHLRELERVGLVEFVEQRRKGNCIERILRATATSYVISPEALGAIAATEGDVR